MMAWPFGRGNSIYWISLAHIGQLKNLQSNMVMECVKKQVTLPAVTSAEVLGKGFETEVVPMIYISPWNLLMLIL